MRHLLTLLSLAFCLTGPAQAQDQKEFFFRKGDRVLFLGDSITEQHQYTAGLELYLVTRFPDWNLFFLNAGISGDTATGGAARFHAHVLAEKPTAITINFGMNDGGYGALDSKRQEAFLENTKKMLTLARLAKVRVALLSPNAVDRRVNERFRQYLETQREFYAPLRGLAEEFGAVFVDQYATTSAALERMEADGAKTVQPFPDGVHTSMQGALLMAHAILTGLNAPALVSEATIDVAAKEARTQRCQVANLHCTSTQVTFERADEALPLPVIKDWVPLLPYVNDLKDLNWYGLRVTGLAPGKYTLAIDGKPVGTYSAGQLVEGINLGNLSEGPLFEQGQKVLLAIGQKNKLVHYRFRNILTFAVPDWLADVAKERRPGELEKRLNQLLVLQGKIYEMATPTRHQFELKAVN